VFDQAPDFPHGTGDAMAAAKRDQVAHDFALIQLG
jgi:hypothetical protein